jgi:hypothetical protein
VARARRPWVTGLLAAGVVAVGVAATVDAIGGSDGPEPARAEPRASAETASVAGRLTGGTLPPLGALPGRLVLLDADRCRPYVLDLASYALGPAGPATSCRAWFAAAVPLAAATRVGEGGTWLFDLDADTAPRQISASTEAVAFGNKGDVLAQCRDGRTFVVRLVDGEVGEVAGCRPVFASDGSLLTRSSERLPTSLLRDGEVILDVADLERGLPPDPEGAISVIGYDESADGLLAVLVARFPGRAQTEDYAPEVMPKLTLQLWRDGELLDRVRVRSVTSGFGSRVELSPTGRQVMITSTNRGVLVVLDLRTRSELLFHRQESGVAWSPAGDWLAVAAPGKIEIRAATTLEVVYELPARVTGLAWLP